MALSSETGRVNTVCPSSHKRYARPVSSLIRLSLASTLGSLSPTPTASILWPTSFSSQMYAPVTQRGARSAFVSSSVSTSLTVSNSSSDSNRPASTNSGSWSVRLICCHTRRCSNSRSRGEYGFRPGRARYGIPVDERGELCIVAYRKRSSVFSSKASRLNSDIPSSTFIDIKIKTYGR
jgi:hypothetical protein